MVNTETKTTSSQFDTYIVWEPGDNGAGIIAYTVNVYGGQVVRKPYYQRHMLNAYQAGYNVPEWWTPPADAIHPNRPFPTAEQGIELAFKEHQEQKANLSPIDQIRQSDADSNQLVTTAIAGDIELVRLAVGLYYDRQIQLYLIILEVVRQAGGKDYVLRADLPVLLDKYRVRCSDRNLSRWLKNGDGIFWTVTRSNRIRLISYKKLAQRLTQIALDKGWIDLVSTNQPGQRRYMYINIASDKQSDFNASVYAAWLASRNNPTIARSTLSRLFNRDISVLREWEAIAGIQVVRNGEHYPQEWRADVPKNKQGDNLREDVREYKIEGETRYKAQWSNTYVVPNAIRQHPKRGQSRRVFHAIEAILESDNPAGISEQGSLATGGLERLDRICFTDGKNATASDFAQLAAQKHGYKKRLLAKGCNRQGEYQYEHSPDGKMRTRAKDCLPTDGRVNYV